MRAGQPLAEGHSVLVRVSGSFLIKLTLGSSPVPAEEEALYMGSLPGGRGMSKKKIHGVEPANRVWEDNGSQPRQPQRMSTYFLVGETEAQRG